MDVARKLNIPLLEMSVFDEVEDVQTLPKVFWEYIHSPNRVGVLDALGYLLRSKSSQVIGDALSHEEKKSLRLFLSEGTSSELTGDVDIVPFDLLDIVVYFLTLMICREFVKRFQSFTDIPNRFAKTCK